MPSPGRFVWYELMTTDTAAAEAFYKAVIDWRAADSGLPGMAYTILSAGETPVGGLMQLPPEAASRGVPPGWLGYIGVEDVDAAVAAVTEAGGKLHRPPADIPQVGRFAVVADPHGAAFVVFRGAMDGPQPAPAGAPGHAGWHELQAGELDGAFAFYSGLFGWTKTMAVDMGPMGTYQTFATGGAEAVGGMMRKVDAAPSPFWLYYFNVTGIDAAVERVKAAGGQVIHGPMQVPGGNWIAQSLDPQGALFAMVASAR